MTATRLEHTGNAAATTITAGISDSDLTITVADATGWPTGGVGPFVATIGAGTASEEKIKVTSRASTTLTVASRGFDSTTAQAHASGVAITHTFSATEADEANVAAVAIVAATGGLVGRTQTQTLTGKTMDGDDNTFSDIPASAIKAAAWTSYTPTWIGSGGNPSLGDGTIAGFYQQIGKTVHFRVELLMGSTTTYGTGAWSFGLPGTTRSISAGTMPILGEARDSSTGLRTVVFGLISGGATTVGMRILGGAGDVSTSVTPTGPFTWASADSLSLHGIYEAA